MGETPSKIRRYEPKTNEELRQLAVDIVSGLVFTSDRIPENQPDLIRLVFMPLVFMKPEDIEELKANEIHIFYEYYSKSLPRSINGMPIFMSMGILDKTDAMKVWDMMKKFARKTEDFLSGGAEKPKDPNQTELFDEDENVPHE